MMRGLGAILILILSLSHLPFADANMVEAMYKRLTDQTTYPIDITHADGCIKAIKLARETHISSGEPAGFTISAIITYKATLRALANFRSSLEATEAALNTRAAITNSADDLKPHQSRAMENPAREKVDQTTRTRIKEILTELKKNGAGLISAKLSKEIDDAISTVASARKLRSTDLSHLLTKIAYNQEIGGASSSLREEQTRTNRSIRLLNKARYFAKLAATAGGFLGSEFFEFLLSPPKPNGSTRSEEYAKEDIVFDSKVEPAMICDKVRYNKPDLSVLLQQTLAIERENRRLPGLLPSKESSPSSVPQR